MTVAAKPTPLTALHRHMFLAIVIVLLCTSAAVAYAASRQRTYTAETRLAVAGSGLNGDNIGAFPLASQEIAADYARYVTNAEEQSQLEEQLGVDEGTISEVKASPIPESNVVRIEVSALRRGAAVKAARQIGEALIAQVNDTTARDKAVADALALYTTLAQQTAAAQTAADAAKLALDNANGRANSGFPRAGDDFAALQANAAATSSALAILVVQRDAAGQKYEDLYTETGMTATLKVVRESAVTGDDRMAGLQRYGLVGVAAGGLLALCLATLLERRRVRRRAAKAATAPPAATRPAPADAGDGARPATAASTDDPSKEDDVTDGSPAEDRSLLPSGARDRAR